MVGIVPLHFILGIVACQDLVLVILVDKDAVIVKKVDGIRLFAVDIQQVYQYFVNFLGRECEQPVFSIFDLEFEEQAPEKDDQYIHDYGVFPQFILDLIVITCIGESEEELDYQLLHLLIVHLLQRIVFY